MQLGSCYETLEKYLNQKLQSIYNDLPFEGGSDDVTSLKFISPEITLSCDHVYNAKLIKTNDFLYILSGHDLYYLNVEENLKSLRTIGTLSQVTGKILNIKVRFFYNLKLKVLESRKKSTFESASVLFVSVHLFWSLVLLMSPTELSMTHLKSQFQLLGS